MWGMGRWSFCSWLDVNRSTFDKDMSRKLIFIVSLPVTYRPQICCRIGTVFRHYISTKLKIPTTFLLRENRKHRTDRRTVDRHTACCWTQSVCLSVYSVSQKNPPLQFSEKFLSKRLGIFNQFFTHLLYDPFYTIIQIFIQISPTMTNLCHTKLDHPANFFYILLEL